MSSTPTMTSTITPTSEQQQALDHIVAWWTAWHLSNGQSQQEFILDGGAGTGKSTVAGLAAQRLGLKTVVPAAYTAKAAKVMREKGLKDASTLHRLLYFPIRNPDGTISWSRIVDGSPAAKADLIILDECSMCPEDIANDLRSYGKPILVLGDIDGQLPPPKGASAFIGRRPDFTLREPQRTVADSPIGRLAWIVRRGGSLRLGSYGDGVVVKSMLSPDAWDLLTDPTKQVIVGKNTNRAAVIKNFRERYNYASIIPEVGEKIICCKNNYQMGVINGDIGTITKLYSTELHDAFIANVEIEGKGLLQKLRIWTGLFYGLKHETDFRRNDTAVFDWAYALTTHKAQGSEYDDVVVVDDKFAIWDPDLRRRWLYTAITRARKSLTVLVAGR